MNDEIWIAISGLDTPHEVSTQGRVKSCAHTTHDTIGRSRFRKEVILSISLMTSGYPRVGIRSNGKQLNLSIHRLVAKAFIPNPENKPEVNHKNGDKLDNRVENLEWVTRKENVNHSRNVLGNRTPQETLTDSQIRQICDRNKDCSRLLSTEFGVQRTTIYRIWHRNKSMLPKKRTIAYRKRDAMGRLLSASTSND